MSCVYILNGRGVVNSSNDCKCGSGLAVASSPASFLVLFHIPYAIPDVVCALVSAISNEQDKKNQFLEHSLELTSQLRACELGPRYIVSRG